ncbi:NUDIX hydrolase N-terminal domain-containing protein [bacterium SCSIO 12741]|nr:NUDIX hydrolase N-terminal domain-containing protein [bacterium SCSIO 12741]
MGQRETLQKLEQLLHLANNGLRFSVDGYNSSRYGQIKEITEEFYKQIPELKDIDLESPDQQGYLTPKVGVNALIVNDQGAILMERRVDDKLWGLPGGWADVGASAEDNVVREVREETGLEVKVKRLLKVISRTPDQRSIVTSYHLLFHCEIVSGELKASHESLEVGWVNLANTEPWHWDHREWVDSLQEMELPQELQGLFS